MTQRRQQETLFSMRAVVVLLSAAVVGPAALSVAAGIVALALWTDAADIVIGVLVISFATSVLAASIVTLVLLRRWNRLARLQADFVANVSHELRTPLTSIQLFADTLLLDNVKDEEERQQCLLALSRETHRLTELIERILHWRRLERGELRLDLRALELRELLDDALQPLLSSGEHGASEELFEIVEERALPPALADRVALSGAVRNVVSNALKYARPTPSSPVQLRLARSSRPGMLLVEVTDRGPGIPKKEQKRVLERFYRSEAARADASLAGTGLGLAIARNVLDAHNGKLELDSHLGWGTCVSIEVPEADREEER